MNAVISPGAEKVLTAVVDRPGSGTTVIVAAVPGKSIVMLGYVLNAAGGGNAFAWTSSAAFNGSCDLGADATLTVPFCPVGWFATPVGGPMSLFLTLASQVSGHILYALRDWRSPPGNL